MVLTLPAGFTGATIDRADAIRTDPAAFDALRADPRARLLVLDGLDPVADDDGRLAWTALADAAPGATLVLLGLDGGEPRFAAYVGPVAARPGPAPIFRMIAQMPAADAALYAAARALIDWHARHGFCANCGSPSEPFRAGWGRRCPACRTEHFPRVDPVVIMLAEHRGRVLVGRQPRFPEGFYSALAGFVEPGEAFEEAVARELHEEAGVVANAVRYVASQPWPFPSSLMIACIAPVDDDAITLDTNELEDAFWVDRAGIAAALAGAANAPFLAPPGYAIARTLLEAWLEGA